MPRFIGALQMPLEFCTRDSCLQSPGPPFCILNRSHLRARSRGAPQLCDSHRCSVPWTVRPRAYSPPPLLRRPTRISAGFASDHACEERSGDLWYSLKRLSGGCWDMSLRIWAENHKASSSLCSRALVYGTSEALIGPGAKTGDVDVKQPSPLWMPSTSVLSEGPRSCGRGWQ